MRCMSEDELYSYLDKIQAGERTIRVPELYEYLNVFLTSDQRRRNLVERYGGTSSEIIFDTITRWLRSRLWTPDELIACELAIRCLELCGPCQSFESINHLASLVLSVDGSAVEARVMRKLALMCAGLCDSKGLPSCELFVDVIERILELHPRLALFSPDDQRAVLRCLGRCRLLASATAGDFLPASRVEALIHAFRR